MDFKRFLQDRDSVEIGLFLGRILPFQFGKKTAVWIADRIFRKKNGVIRNGFLKNQRVIAPEGTSEAELELRVQEACRSLVLNLWDYFYFYNHPEECKKAFSENQVLNALREEILNGNEPLFFLIPHLGNFDLLGLIFGWFGAEITVLSAPSPRGSYKAQNDLRRGSGLKMLPMSLAAYREARKELRKNGRVVTGIDRPMDDPNLRRRPIFFGKPSLLPTFYEKLPIETHAKILSGAALRQEDGSYKIIVSDPIYFDKDEAYEGSNIAKLTSVVEEWIRAYPTQWAIYRPLWPDDPVKEEKRNYD